MKHKVYVYGTLRPGNTPQVLVPGTIYDLGWFPGLVLGGDDGASFVTCEIIEVDDEGLARLDTYEGYHAKYPESSLYLRQKYEDGFIYVYNEKIGDRELVQSGDWLEYTGEDSGSNAQLGQLG